MVYRVKNDWDERGPRGTLWVQELVGATPAAERELWAWVISVDLVGAVKGVAPAAADARSLLMLAEPRRLGLTVGDGLWLRLVDLPAALAARSYAASGTSCSRCAMPTSRRTPGAGGWRRRLPAQATPAAASTRPSRGRATRRTSCSTSPTSARRTSAGLTSADLWRADRIEERRPGALREADAMFASAVVPWCPTMF